MNILQKRFGASGGGGGTGGGGGGGGQGKLKAEVVEIVGMLKEYFDKSGREEDRLKMCELDMRLMKVTSDDEVCILKNKNKFQKKNPMNNISDKPIFRTNDRYFVRNIKFQPRMSCLACFRHFPQLSFSTLKRNSFPILFCF